MMLVLTSILPEAPVPAMVNCSAAAAAVRVQ